MHRRERSGRGKTLLLTTDKHIATAPTTVATHCHAGAASCRPRWAVERRAGPMKTQQNQAQPSHRFILVLHPSTYSLPPELGYACSTYQKIFSANRHARAAQCTARLLRLLDAHALHICTVVVVAGQWRGKVLQQACLWLDCCCCCCRLILLAGRYSTHAADQQNSQYTQCSCGSC